MARISVVVPVYNVEAFLEPCLESIARQTAGDFEVVMVDDGSTDSSAAIARRFAERDDRFRLVQQENGGLSAARNTGIDHATGEFMWFVDSDDVLPVRAFELLLGALDETGSDFATGNVHRLVRGRTSQQPFLDRAFSRTRLRTHITRDRALLADRTAWNKLWRRSFWDAHGLRFPVGRINEDIPVVLPLHFSARSVDVIAEPVYFWRVRQTGELSITERRLERKALLDRVHACRDVSEYLGAHGPRRAKHWYDQSMVADDLRYYVNVLDRAEPWYRELFLEKVNELLDTADDDIYDPLPAIERLKWHLVRRRLMPELLEVLRFEREEMSERPFIRSGRRWYGDYPFRGDRRLAVPDSIYRLDQELRVQAHVDSFRREGDSLRVDGWAFIDGVGAARPGDQRVTLSLLSPGRFRRLRYLVSAVRFRTEAVHRPDANARSRQEICDVSWSGFSATLPARRLRRAGRWDVYVTVKAGGARRARMRFSFDPLRPPRAVDLPAGSGLLARAAPTVRREITVEASQRWAKVGSAVVADGALTLSGELGGVSSGEVELHEADGPERRRYSCSGDGSSFTVAIPVAEVADAEREWTLFIGGAQVALPDDFDRLAWPAGERELVLSRTARGDALLIARAPRPLVSGARWEDGGTLVLEGDGAPAEVVLFAEDRLAEHRFAGRITPPGVRGRYELCDGSLVPVAVCPELERRMPLETTRGHRKLTLAAGDHGGAFVSVGPDLAPDETGPYHQRLLRLGAPRTEPLLDQVVYLSFRGRELSDSPRAIHDELVRRGAPLDHLWVVADGAFTATGAIRAGSRDYYAALARARYVVTNDRLPDWFERRDGQVVIQTWHGTPVRRADLAGSGRVRGRRLASGGRAVTGDWSHLVSPNRFSTPLLREAFEFEGEVLEVGYPRTDALAGPQRDARMREARERLGVPDGARVALYAPVLREHDVDERGRHRLQAPVDLPKLREALGPGGVLLVAKDPAVAGDVSEGGVRDVSSHPDRTELLLAADALITDYSPLMVDFANTGRPMILFAYDLDDQREELTFDYEATVPGPVLTTADDLADALSDPDAARHPRYDAFVSEFCALDDGAASARVADAVFTAQAESIPATERPAAR